jgi:NADH-quinone oxidoreductase subunit G
MHTPKLTVNDKPIAIAGERNLLELIRKAGIEIPTFCYHSELSIYGACRLCLVDIEGRGVVASCSVAPEENMVVRTHTAQIRRMRKITVELLLAQGHENCTTCAKNGSCKLQDLARQLGIREVRFAALGRKTEKDTSCPALTRDPDKCVLCGDCVRFCHEVQGIGAIDFAHRGAKARVCPAFDHDLEQVECVHCGQCARVCPTGAITPASQIDEAWKALDAGKFVVAQIAPAVRVAAGEHFGLGSGGAATGQTVAALKAMGFARVFDTSFAADLTVLEEAEEFIQRKLSGENLPQFTSCCPAWVRFCEQYYPDLLGHLSSCRSPQQMFGAVARRMLPEVYGIDPEDLVIVSVMPCTAKKQEAKLEKFAPGGRADVDIVLTTQELGTMIEQAGVRFADLTPESMDLPLGFKTGAGVIFGASGGVSEAVLRYAAEKVTGAKLQNVEFRTVRGAGSLRDVKIRLGDTKLNVAIVHGLRQAEQICRQIRRGQCRYDLIEVMSCPGGCIGGAGQPVSTDRRINALRGEALYDVDRTLQLHKSQENPYIRDLYDSVLSDRHEAHELLHTRYRSRRRSRGQDLELTEAGAEPTEVRVCVGTSCYVRGSQALLNGMIRRIDELGLSGKVQVRASFCLEQCNQGPTVRIGPRVLHHATLEQAEAALLEAMEQREARAGG